MIVYLHGFRSSPHSFKARMLAEKMRELGREAELVSPQLPASPRGAIALVESIIAGRLAEEVAVVGSSLGGYYATWIAEAIGCRAVLLNPAVKPPRDLERYVGVTTAYHSDTPFEFKPQYVNELRSLELSRITRPERYFLIAATGDEVLDWREMATHYSGARQTIVDGSDHGLSDFAQHVDAVLKFCGVDVARASP